MESIVDLASRSSQCSHRKGVLPTLVAIAEFLVHVTLLGLAMHMAQHLFVVAALHHRWLLVTRHPLLLTVASSGVNCKAGCRTDQCDSETPVLANKHWLLTREYNWWSQGRSHGGGGGGPGGMGVGRQLGLCGPSKPHFCLPNSKAARRGWAVVAPQIAACAAVHCWHALQPPGVEPGPVGQPLAPSPTFYMLLHAILAQKCTIHSFVHVSNLASVVTSFVYERGGRRSLFPLSRDLERISAGRAEGHADVHNLNWCAST